MNNRKFEIGDVVQLKSGGPQMTIVGIFGVEGVPDDVENSYMRLKGFEEGDLYCTWFTEDGSKKQKGFKRETVQIDDRE